MEKHNGSKGLALVECINPALEKYRVRWNMTTSYDADGNERGVNFYEHECIGIPTTGQVVEWLQESETELPLSEVSEICNSFELELPLETARELLARNISLYDVSNNVNGFILGTETEWIDRETRVSVTDSATKEKRLGRTETTLWLSGVKYVLPIDTVLALLDQIEIYAKDCFNVTKEHQAEVALLEDIESIMKYDYTSGYPDMLTINLAEE